MLGTRAGQRMFHAGPAGVPPAGFEPAHTAPEGMIGSLSNVPSSCANASRHLARWPSHTPLTRSVVSSRGAWAHNILLGRESALRLICASTWDGGFSSHSVWSERDIHGLVLSALGEPLAYVPILKGKAGEFLALEHVTPAVRSCIRPVMELVPDPDVRDVLETFCDRAMDAVPQGAVLTVDSGALPTARVLEGDSGGPIARLSESLGLRGVLMCPVVRCTDPRDVLAEVFQAIAAHQSGACLRLSVGVDSLDPLPHCGQIRGLLRALHLDPEEVDLLIDAGPVDSSLACDRLADRALAALKALSPWRWRRECVASGAFPVNLTGFPRGQATPVARRDAQLWRRVVSGCEERPPDFGDFGVTHPRMPVKSRGTPDPNMRYTTLEEWQVFVYPRVRAGNDDFFTLSTDLVDSSYWPVTGAQTSWGDARLKECATRQRPKAGGGAEWRAWATSHHLAMVTSSLTTLGRP
ncbi:beta family protein [Streptomyces sp. NPDC001549]|uniref:beta family protein n=1 Tax=Streptomyces sp. NPDC001549 TaxID=3364586 RepID=UPI0036873580